MHQFVAAVVIVITKLHSRVTFWQNFPAGHQMNETVCAILFIHRGKLSSSWVRAPAKSIIIIMFIGHFVRDISIRQLSLNK